MHRLDTEDTVEGVRDNRGDAEEMIMTPVGTGVLDGMLTGAGVGASTGGGGRGNDRGGKEGVDVEMISEVCVRSLGPANGEGLCRTHQGRFVWFTTILVQRNRSRK